MLGSCPCVGSSCLPSARPFCASASCRPVRQPLGQAWAAGSEPALLLANLLMDNKAGEITVRFGVSLEDPTEFVARALKEGTSAVLILRGRTSSAAATSSWDEAVGAAASESLIRYEPLSREYILERGGEDQPLRHKNLAALVERGWRSLALDLGPFNRLTPGESYALELRVRLKRQDVPLWVKNSLFFWSWELVPEVRYRLDFTA